MTFDLYGSIFDSIWLRVWITFETVCKLNQKWMVQYLEILI